MITTQTLTTGIHAFLTQKIKELDMQLRKPATAILAWRFPQDWHRQMTPPRQQAARWTKSPKTA